MTRSELSAIARIMDAADRATPQVRAQVLKALEELRKSVSAADIERARRAQDALMLHQIASALPQRLRPALNTLRDVMRSGAVIGAGQASSNLAGHAATSLEVIRNAATREAREHAAQLVTRVTEETRKAIRSAVAQRFRQGASTRDTARIIQSLVGLTPRQANAVLRRYDDLIGDGLSRATAEKRARLYAERLIRQRAMTIARTETIGAATRGQLSAWAQLQVRGQLPQAVRKQWMTTPDDRLCPKCRLMDGRTQLLGLPFTGPKGLIQAPPLHPNCRCAISLKFAQRAA